MVTYSGNNTKSLHLSLEASLKKLRTTYIDILYVHWWDYTTSVEEVVNSLHILVQQGKVLYLEISDSLTWVVSKANQYAKDHSKTPLRVTGLALAPWGVLGAGKIAEDARRWEKGRTTFGPDWERTPEEIKSR
ncbi:NADP-dependent oxidoreductase domain-containing protein [Lactarius deliciosus]|nr:NADP-dependent oxidoreductase domain-containing protein [Lactarius deliciosus]